MTEERDPKVSGRYRELEREEPARALDDAILAASRRSLRRRPWLYPAVGIAAVMVLAVAISVQVEREQPDATAVPTTPAPAAKEEAAKPAEPVAKAEPAQPRPPLGSQGRSARNEGQRRADAPPPREFVPDPKPAPPELAKREASPDTARRDAAGAGAAADRVEERAAQGPVGSASAPAPAAAPAAKPSSPAPEARARVAERPLAALQLDEAPMPWLERIAKLREEGKHDEADRALAEFRKRYPDFKIPESLQKKVER
jgi:hypothetical protein